MMEAVAIMMYVIHQALIVDDDVLGCEASS